MPKNANTYPSFFKVLIAVDFKKLLRFPPAFSKKHGPNPGTKTKLRSPSGATWKVKVEKMEYGTLCFTKGWQNAFQLGELVFFTRVAPSEFDVSIFRTNFCERQIPHSHANLNIPHERRKASETTRNEDVSPRKSSSPLYFEVHLKNYQQSRLYLPSKFVVAGKLEGESHVRMEFVGGRGSGEGERVVLDNNHIRRRTSLANGWSKFRIENRLVFGKIYSFELTNHQGINVILVMECQKE